MNNAAAIKRGSSSLLIVFIVFVLVLCSMFLILYGAYVYGNVRDRVDADFTRRMGVSYITNKLRASDVRGGVTVENDSASLRLCAEPEAGIPLYIYIYHYDGNIMEYTTQELEPFDPGDGEVVMAADHFTVSPISGGFAVSLGVGPENISYTVSMKSV